MILMSLAIIFWVDNIINRDFKHLTFEK